MKCKIFKRPFKRENFGFAQVYDKFSEMAPLFVFQEIPDCNIPEEMKIYKEKTGKKTVKRKKRY